MKFGWRIVTIHPWSLSTPTPDCVDREIEKVWIDGVLVWQTGDAIDMKTAVLAALNGGSDGGW